MNRFDLKSKFIGSMLGSALGDAIGEIAFSGYDEEELRAVVEETNVLVYTDDTAMALGLAESLVRQGRIEEKHLGDTFRENFRQEPWRGYAAGPPTIFSLVERKGMPYSEAALGLFGNQGSFGNGAAMRVAPVGLFFYDAPDLYEQARASAVVTHTHPMGVDGAALLALAVARVVEMDSREPFPLASFTQDLVNVCRTSELQAKMRQVRTLLEKGAPPPEAASMLGRTVAVHESLPFALYAFLCNPESFEDCLFCAVQNGGDRDTLGAMACAVSGAYLGEEAIPQLWRERLENRLYVEELAEKLTKMKGNS